MEKEEVFRKLKIRISGNNLIVNAPDEYLAILQGVEFVSTPEVNKSGKYDFVQVFASSEAEMKKLILQVADAGKHDCLFWACSPKSVGKLKYDLKREIVWDALSLAGLRPVSQFAIDEKWSALRGRDPELVRK